MTMFFSFAPSGAYLSTLRRSRTRWIKTDWTHPPHLTVSGGPHWPCRSAWLSPRRHLSPAPPCCSGCWSPQSPPGSRPRPLEQLSQAHASRCCCSPNCVWYPKYCRHHYTPWSRIISFLLKIKENLLHLIGQDGLDPDPGHLHRLDAAGDPDKASGLIGHLNLAFTFALECGVLLAPAADDKAHHSIRDKDLLPAPRWPGWCWPQDWLKYQILQLQRTVDWQQMTYNIVANSWVIPKAFSGSDLASMVMLTWLWVEVGLGDWKTAEISHSFYFHYRLKLIISK